MKLLEIKTLLTFDFFFLFLQTVLDVLHINLWITEWSRQNISGTVKH